MSNALCIDVRFLEDKMGLLKDAGGNTHCDVALVSVVYSQFGLLVNFKEKY